MKNMEILESAMASWLPLPSFSFEKLEHDEYSKLSSYINQQIKDSMYALFPNWKLSYIWMRYERLLHSIFHDLRTLKDEETCTQVHIGTIHALQSKWLVFCEMTKSVKELGYSYCHIFADKVDLLLYYGNQAETLVGDILKYIDYFFDNELFINQRRTKKTDIEGLPAEITFSILFNTKLSDEKVENCKIFIKSLESLPYLLRDCAFSQTYYLFKNSCSLYTNAENFQQQIVGIYNSRRNTFIKDYNNALKKIGRKDAVSKPERFSVLREDAFSDTMQKSYSDVYQLYERYRGKLESLNDSSDYTQEGWLQTFFTNIFQTHYIGEQRDAEGNITTILVDDKGNTSVDGRWGWERWLDLLTVISLVRDYEQQQYSKCTNKTRGKKIKTFREFIKEAARTEDIMKKLHYHIGNQTDTDALKVIAKAMWIDWIYRPTSTSIKKEFPTVTCSETIISRCMKEPPPTHPSMIEKIRKELEST